MLVIIFYLSSTCQQRGWFTVTYFVKNFGGRNESQGFRYCHKMELHSLQAYGMVVEPVFSPQEWVRSRALASEARPD